MKRFAQLTIAAILGSGMTMALSQWYAKGHPRITIEHIPGSPIASVAYAVGTENVIPLDFTGTAEKVTPAVVYVQSTKLETAEDTRYNPFHNFFYDQSPQRRQQPSQSSGSGVIVSDKGYIVTNYHVVKGAERVQVTLSNSNTTMDAEIVGVDQDTDIALLKIDKDKLPYLSFVDSDDSKVGQWVLAVGNPFNLNSTVTAGIISAKGRNINIIGSNNRNEEGQGLGSTAIESFIQTDAAINPGNSGGALVDLQGGLLGINTAIASPTGSYSGYGFAVPANIASKVVEDLIAYGVVQRGWLGISIQNVSSELAAQEDLEVTEGAYVSGFADNSAAEKAGLKQGDVVVQLDDIEIKSNTALIEYVGKKRPGDKIQVTVNRRGKTVTIPVVLKNKQGGVSVVKPKEESQYALLGIQLEELNTKELKQLELENGVRVNDILKGKIARYTNMKKGFIITHIDNEPVQSIQQVETILKKKEKGELVTFAGVYGDFPREYIYAIRM